MKFKQWLHRVIFNVLRPFLKWASGVHLPYTHKKVTGLDYYNLRRHLIPGVIFLTKIEGDLTSILIPGYWSHAAIYAPDNSKYPSELVMEAEGQGVIRTDLASFVTTKDGLVALEPKNLGPKKEQIMARAAEIASGQKGKLYDFNFKLHFTMHGVTPTNPIGPEEFYCSKLVWWAYDQACAEFGVKSPFKPIYELGVLTVTPDGISQDTDDFSVLFLTKPK